MGTGGNEAVDKGEVVLVRVRVCGILNDIVLSRMIPRLFN